MNKFLNSKFAWFTLGMTVLVLIAADVTTTMFDTTYFSATDTKVSIVGTLTNWAKLSTNAASSFTTGAGVTNQANVLSGNYTAGSNITLTTNANGAVAIAVPTATTNTAGVVQPDGSTITVSGGVISAVGGGVTGAVSNNVASAGLLAVDGTKTNGIAATAAHVSAALGNLGSSIPTPVSANGTSQLTNTPIPATSFGNVCFFNFHNISGMGWSSGTVTLTNINGVHNLAVGNLISVAGSNPSGYNGTYRVTAIPTTLQVQFSLASNPGAYVGSAYMVTEPELQMVPGMPNVPAMMFAAHPQSVPLGLDPLLPIVAFTGADRNYKNNAWFIAADGHSQDTYYNGNLVQFANGVFDSHISNWELGWTSTPTRDPGTSANRDLVLTRIANGQAIFYGTNKTSIASLNVGRPGLAKTANYTVLFSDSNTVLSNSGASGEVDFTLPTWAAGLTYTFDVEAAQTLKVIAPGTDTIRIAGSASAAGGNVTNATIGGALTIVATVSGKWVAISHEGTWSVN